MCRCVLCARACAVRVVLLRSMLTWLFRRALTLLRLLPKLLVLAMVLVVLGVVLVVPGVVRDSHFLGSFSYKV